MFEVDPAGGQVVVTRFECVSLRKLLRMLVLHLVVKRHVRRHSHGLIGSRVVVDWRQRVMLSVSLWSTIDSVYSMGEVHRHVKATRVPARLGIRTTAGVFSFVGDWRKTMFGDRTITSHSPFAPLPVAERKVAERKEETSCNPGTSTRR